MTSTLKRQPNLSDIAYLYRTLEGYRGEFGMFALEEALQNHRADVENATPPNLRGITWIKVSREELERQAWDANRSKEERLEAYVMAKARKLGGPSLTWYVKMSELEGLLAPGAVSPAKEVQRVFKNCLRQGRFESNSTLDGRAGRAGAIYLPAGAASYGASGRSEQKGGE